jgi:hypothetical protein
MEVQVGIKSMTGPKEIFIYPNPTTGLITVSLKEPFDTDYLIDIYNTSGHSLQSISKNKSEQDFYINLSNYPQGIYIVRFRSKNEIYYYKVIKK